MMLISGMADELLMVGMADEDVIGADEVIMAENGIAEEVISGEAGMAKEVVISDEVSTAAADEVIISDDVSPAADVAMTPSELTPALAVPGA